MLEVLGLKIPVHGALSFLAGRWWSFLFSVAGALLLGWVLYPALVRMIRLWTRKTATEMDDKLLAHSRRPFLLFLSVLAAIQSWHSLHLGQAARTVDRVLLATLVAVTAYWLQRLFSQILMHHVQSFAEKTETNLDDVLVPIARQLGPAVIYLIGLAFVLQTLGVSIPLLVAGIGGASFVAGLALQDSLSNMFSGISLLIDTPFKYGDLVVLHGSTICEVKKIGLRVTQLYNVEEHSVHYLPNKDLANQELVNLTWPSPDMAVSIHLGVAYTVDIARVRAVLEEVLASHPDILGTIGEKTSRLRERLARAETGAADKGSREKLRNGIARLEAEQAVDRSIGAIGAKLSALARLVDETRRSKELGGETLDSAAREVQELRTAIDGESGGEQGVVCLRRRIGLWADEIVADPDLREFAEDQARVRKQAQRAVELLRKRTKQLEESVYSGRSETELLAHRFRETGKWLAESFKKPVPSWKNPRVDFVNFGDSALEFRLRFFVDNINLEHFERRRRVTTEVREAIVERLRAEGMEIPFPQRDLWLRSPSLPREVHAGIESAWQASGENQDSDKTHIA